MTGSPHSPRPAHRDESGVVIIFMVAIIVALAMMGTAFVMMARQESSAARNTLAATQAEMIARAGLEHAVAEIEHCRSKLPDTGSGEWEAICPDGVFESSSPPVDFNPGKPPGDPAADWGWHRYFAGDATGIELPWADHYENEVYSKALTPQGGRDSYPANCYSRWIVFPKDDPLEKIGRYAVCVVDLDGKLHSSLGEWDADIEGDADDIKACLNAWQIADGGPWPPDSTLASTLVDASAMYSLGELVPTVGLAELSKADEWLKGVACYPVPDTGVALPPVNVNTCREAVLRALIEKIPELEADDRDAVVTKITGERPFTGWRHLEEELAELAPSPVGDDTLEEIEFNNLLNSLNNREESIFCNDATYDETPPGSSTPGTSGIYEFDFEPAAPPPPPPNPPANTGGDKTSAADVTWCCPVKFRSRFFQVHVTAELVSPTDGSVLSRRALQAVYDAEGEKLLYFRWELVSR